MNPLTLFVTSTRPIKYSHRGRVELRVSDSKNISIELVCQIDPVHKIILDCRWTADESALSNHQSIDAVIAAWIGQTVEQIDGDMVTGNLVEWAEFRDDSRMLECDPLP